MVWRLMKWQPLYGPVRRLASGQVKSKRAKKRLVVMAARRLAIDLCPKDNVRLRMRERPPMLRREDRVYNQVENGLGY
jgi:hypothetical protein